MKNNIDIFSISFICSIIIHLIIIYFFLFGLPSLFPTLPEEQVIVFEMLPIKTKANVPNKIKQNDKALENETAKKILQSEPEPVKENKPEPVKENKPEPVKENKPEPVKENKPEPVKENKPEPVKENKPEPVKENKPEPVKENKLVDKKKILDKTDLDSLLKNLEQSSEGTKAKTINKARPKENLEQYDSQGPYDNTLALSITEISLIKQQIEKHWNIPIGVQNIAQAEIYLYIALNPDSSIQEVKIKEAICPNISGNACNALSDSAVRAVWQASPIHNLDPKRYNIWKEFIFKFTPNKIIR
ncbi:energy transducer TonB [Candidatus Tisiphia endosymbiont of Nemotelus uliginosus]|uniref:energy transducer TonB n=1 Tax=Candidatus Tisiphia endosymbiont of Nemotelus uliginosus TaxID=3077926 RepID=UPI0035C8F4F0